MRNLKLSEIGADKWFAFGAMLLVIVGCEIYTGLHVLKFLRDNALPAVGLLAFGTFCALFYTYYGMCSTDPKRAKTAIILKLIMMGVFIAASVSVIVYNQEMSKRDQAKVETVAKEEREAKRKNERTKTVVEGAVQIGQIKDRQLRRAVGEKLVSDEDQKKEPESKTDTDEELRAKAGIAKPDEGLMVGVKKTLFDFADTMAIVYVPAAINFICFCVMILVIASTATAAIATQSVESRIGFTPDPVGATAKENVGK